MNLKSDEERWAVWMVQARRFAERENFTDAVARVKLVRDAVQEALAQATAPKQRERLERHLARADEQLASMESQYDAWRSEIAARRQRTIDQAEEEMARPLPVPAD
jgi:predicted  nucleic acid-binding Zn-ribbon protein